MKTARRKWGHRWRGAARSVRRTAGCRGGFEPLENRMMLSAAPLSRAPELLPGDANQDLTFDQLDLLQVMQAGRYLTGQPATWAQGDWDGAPGGRPGAPPAGDGVFDQQDIVAALQTGRYLAGPLAAIDFGGVIDDDQTSIVYNPVTGELAVDAPTGRELTSINIDSASAVFTCALPQNLDSFFNPCTDNNIFKASFGSSFGSLSFGNVAMRGVSETFVANDLTVVGSLAGGGDLGAVDLVRTCRARGAAIPPELARYSSADEVERILTRA